MKAHSFKVKTFPIPPAGFDVTKATKRLLARHGFPACPDRENAPALYGIWRAIFGRKLKFVVPKFRSSQRAFGGVQPSQQTVLPNVVTPAVSAGSVVPIASGNRVFPYLFSATWQVPNVWVPPGGSTSAEYASIMSVGVDGYSSHDIFHAGTAHFTGQTTLYYAWYEWLIQGNPASTGLVEITNLPISPGDLVSCLLQVFGPTGVSVVMSNQTRGTAATFAVNAPAGAALSGESVEWLLQRPTNAAGQIFDLPDFGPSFMVGGGGTGSTSFTISDGTLIMMDENGDLMAVASLNGIQLRPG